MQLNFKGNAAGPVVILLGDVLLSPAHLDPLADRLKEKCCVLQVTYDGHGDDKTVYTTANDQAAQILAFLHRQEIEEVALIAGFSAGAAMALQLVHALALDGSIRIGRVICESGRYTASLWPARVLKKLPVRYLMGIARKGTPEEAASALMQNVLIRLITHGDPTFWRPLLEDFVATARKLDNKSAMHAVDSACRFDFPELPEEVLRRTVFTASAKDPAGRSLRRAQRHYPQAIYQLTKEAGRLGLAFRNPKEYALLLLGLAGCARQEE